MTNGAPTATAWIEEQLQRALGHIEVLSREVTHLQRALAARERDADELRQAVAAIGASAQRQDAGRDLVRELGQAIGRLDDRITEEASLRRDLTARVMHSNEREQLDEQAIERALLGLQDRIAEVERGFAAVVDRQAATSGGITVRDARELQLSARVDALTAQVDAVTQQTRRANGGATAPDEQVAEVQQFMRVAGAQAVDRVRELRRLEGELASLRHLAEREESLSDLAEQHRVLRQRVESGLATLEARVATTEDSRVIEAEERRLLRVRLETVERRVDALYAQLDDERGVLLEHFGRATETAEAAGRRQSQEIARQARAARELLVRLRETADEAAREQPL